VRRLAFPLLIAAALALAGCQRQDEAFGAKVRAYLLEHPEVLQEVAQKLDEKEKAQAVKVSQAAIKHYRNALERDPRDFVANPGGKITVVEFFDYNCGYCKVAAPAVVQLIADNPDVRFVFKEYPFQTEQSLQAAKLALGARAQGKTLALHQALMAAKPLNAAAIERSLESAGVDAAAAGAEAQSAAVLRHLRDTHELAQQLGIDGTPTFIVGDRLINGADMRALQAALVQARGGGASAGRDAAKG
jgi:protein-disulfide isomerase